MDNKIRDEVVKLLDKDKSGHGMIHVDRVTYLAKSFAEYEHANVEEVKLIALLHDVDDYKLFGHESQEKLTNARNIMHKIGIDVDTQERICSQLKCIGYSKYLKKMRPDSLEGMIVSDADMCDALGATGILRVFQFGLKIDRPFFKIDEFPKKEDNYGNHLIPAPSTVNFIFEVLFNYPNIMLTDSGKKEAKARIRIMIDFLRNYFEEEKANEWLKYLDEYLISHKYLQ
ncbi:MAG: HD domain-containing protein [Bacilli bacterium]|nr:HD domain-containing protein [Bacilli bacterium]